MKLAIAGALLCAVAFCPSDARADIVTYGPSVQAVTLTGAGDIGGGIGSNKVIFGTCAFDGANTNCTLSAPYSGLGGGGTMNIIFTYPGNGASPLLFNSVNPGSDLITAALVPGGSGSFLVKLAKNNGPTITFYTASFNLHFDSTAKCTLVSTCAPGLVGLTPNATMTGVVSGAFDASPIIRNSQGVITAGNYGGYSAVAPGTWMEIYGTNLATVVSQTWAAGDFNGNQAPTSVGGTSVTIGGIPAYVQYVSPGQVNAQVPSGVGTGFQNVVVTTAGGASAPSSIPVNPLQPGLLAPPQLKLAAGQYVAALFPDGQTFVLPPIAGVPTARAKPGETIIFYGVGFGPVTPDIPAGQIETQSNALATSFTASFAGTPAKVTFAGLASTFVGLYQFNVVVPNIAPSDAVLFTYTLGGAAVQQKNLVIAIGQ